MCLTRAISNSILILGTRTYRQHLRAVSRPLIPTSGLSRLAEDLENFYMSLHAQWNSITEEDYSMFGGQLTVVLETLHQMIKAYRVAAPNTWINRDLDRLEAVYNDLVELDNDIRQFKIRLPKDADMPDLMAKAADALNRLAI